MKSIIKLKEQARTHEQKEAWEKAIASYREALKLSEEQEGEAELPLYNKIGDLYLRLGRAGDAVEQYEQAADRYAEAGLYNNAIALCNKALRHAPGRLEVYRRLSRFCAEQGFAADARRWILEYAEKVGATKGPEEAFEALEEFAELARDPEIGEMLGERLTAHGRTDEALEQLRRAYGLYLEAGRDDRAQAVRAAIERLDPEADFDEDPLDEAEDAPSHAALDEPDGAGFDPDHYGAVELESAADAAGFQQEADDEDEAEVEPLPLLDGPVEDAEASSEPGGSTGAFGALDVGLESTDEAAGDGAAEDADPTDFGTLDLDGVDLDGVDLGDLDESDAEPLPLLDVGDSLDPEGVGGDEEAGGDGLDPSIPGAEPEASEPAGGIDVDAGLQRARERLERGDRAGAIRELDGLQAELAQAGRFAEAHDVLGELVEVEPGRLQHYQLRVEYASRAGEAGALVEAYLELAGALEARGAATQAHAVLQRVLDLDPDNERARAGLSAGSARSQDYVDLADFLGDELDALDERREATRMVVAEKAPSGDGDRDFAEMLSQFKSKVADSVSAEDAASHYDLGLAFREMGLVDEAIGEFETALRGGGESLKVYEELGHCYVLKGQYTMAVKILGRALQLPHESESDLLGVYYHLGLCYEELGQRGEARDAYERVAGINVGFRDVPDRLARL